MAEITKEAKAIQDDTEELRSYWNLRDVQILKDRDLLNLIKPPPKSDRIQWISNEPKVFYETSTALISSFPPRYRMPLTINYTPDEKEQMSKSERMVLGVWRERDRRQIARGQSYWLREFAWNVLSGWYAVFHNVVRRGETVEFIADIWDAINVYPQWDSYGLAKCVRTYQVPAITAVAMASEFYDRGLRFKMPTPKPDDMIQIYNHWIRRFDKNGNSEVKNAIIIGDTLVKPPMLQKGLDNIPIKIGAIGVPERTSGDWQQRWGESILSSDRDIYGYENTMLSLMATVMAETTYPNLVSTTASGESLVKGRPKGYGDEIKLRFGQTIDLLKHAATPSEVNILLNYFGSQRQKGSLPDIVYGGISLELSGFAISQLMAAIRYKLAPYLNTIQFVIAAISTDDLNQYAAGDEKGAFPGIKLSTTDPRQLKKGLFFVEEFTPEDVPDNRFVEVTIPITSTLDKTQQIQFARQAIAPPQLLSRETLWDGPLDVQDGEQEYARILQDQTLELPVVKQIMMIEGLRMRVEQFRVKKQMKEAMALEKHIKMLEIQLGMRKETNIVLPGQEGAGNLPPETLPPEMTGNSPDVEAAIRGQAPPGVSRRPQTSQERTQTQNRRGLVSRIGEPLA